MILQLLLGPDVSGVGVEQLDHLVPTVFSEAFPFTVTVGYHRLAGGNEYVVITFAPMGDLLSRRLGLAWRRVGFLGGTVVKK